MWDGSRMCVNNAVKLSNSYHKWLAKYITWSFTIVYFQIEPILIICFIRFRKVKETVVSIECGLYIHPSITLRCCVGKEENVNSCKALF